MGNLIKFFENYFFYLLIWDYDLYLSVGYFKIELNEVFEMLVYMRYFFYFMFMLCFWLEGYDEGENDIVDKRKLVSENL